LDGTHGVHHFVAGDVGNLGRRHARVVQAPAKDPGDVAAAIGRVAGQRRVALGNGRDSGDPLAGGARVVGEHQRLLVARQFAAVDEVGEDLEWRGGLEVADGDGDSGDRQVELASISQRTWRIASPTLAAERATSSSAAATTWVIRARNVARRLAWPLSKA